MSTASVAEVTSPSPQETTTTSGLSNPIPLAAIATSHVDQLDSQHYSPPQPPLAFSPGDTSTTNSSPPPPALPPLSLDFNSPTDLVQKQHPADLVSISNPDPHNPSPPASPTDSATTDPHHSFSQPFEGDESATSFPNHEGGTSNHGRGAEAASSILSASENGVTLGHGSEEGGHGGGGGHTDSPRVNGRRTSGSAFGDSQVLVESDAEGEGEEGPQHDGEGEGEGEEEGDQVEALVPLSYTPTTSIAPTASSTPRKSHAHGRSQSMATPSTSTSRPPSSSSSSPRQPPSTSASNDRPSSSSAREGTSADRDRERRGERRDREREREREAAAAAGAVNGSSKEREGKSGEKEREKESTRSRRVLGEWTMSKTLGAGSMGKVKLGISGVTGEKVAIKIIPRFTSTAAANRPPPKSSSSKDPPTAEEKEWKPPTASFLAKAAAKDQSKEVRTMREGSLSLLLHHPYVCGMKSMMLYPNHYYMIFEYVNGGQMLDYIISHGRLRERSARKFARQIGSALEYCHANSIVHRDLKIENILISKTGNIKIIDFGLSNLYSPTSHLSTFCGSLYFAAPELLNAKPYTGPEVDVWSFGIVLYVLVCGKVPFDDQSMPALHAKIKRGQVEYPGWLSAGFSGPPSSHLPPRSPLRADDLDREIIKGMVGFELGSDQEVYEKLRDVLLSDGYRQAVRMWEGRRAAGLSRAGGRRDDDSDGAGGGGGVSNGHHGVGGGRVESLDPTRGFHPLISLYFLVKEKIEREKIWGPGVFASSTLSLTGPPPPPAPAMVYQAGSGTRPRSSYEPASPTPQRTSHIIDRTGSGVGSHSQDPPPPSPRQTMSPLLSPSGFARRFGSLLGRSSSTTSDFKPGHRQRASIAGTSHRASTKTPASALLSPPEGKAVHRSSTVGELSPNRHQRGVSMGAESLGRATVGVGAGAASERRRLSSMGEAARPLTRPRTSGIDAAALGGGGGGAPSSTIQDRHHQDDPLHHQQQDVGFVGRTASSSAAGSEQAKPVWLKGLFSVTTTSTKPAATIRADLIRVLDRLGVQHRDVKSGFECAHVPSIDLSSVGAGKKDQAGGGGGRGTIRRRASNLLLSSGGGRKDKDSNAPNADDSSTSLGNAQAGGAPPHAASSTSFDPTSPTFDSSSPQQAQGSPNLHQQGRFNSSTAEGSSVSSELIVRFEIFIVRMPLLPGISGLQFRRIGGNAWQYQMLARRVLAELKL
ncbi:hypothetical protein BCR35DRAFT_308894 [Leucosporidium creatinivorum]|uniref:non-specific serine/threonine protein kinase n=1 Tax=Leucosporidium creatinivorum TaxID=106004 RepID=A0A1Y2DUD7_9BASI|nr:hypothetical protein BCR35DRAFT_308894 [Leucosporidium creatinivorum]